MTGILRVVGEAAITVCLDHLKWVTLLNLMFTVVTWLWTLAWSMLWTLYWLAMWFASTVSVIGTAAVVQYVTPKVVRYLYPSYEAKFDLYVAAVTRNTFHRADFMVEGFDETEAAVRKLQLACISLRVYQQLGQPPPMHFREGITDTLYHLVFGQGQILTLLNPDQVLRTLVVLTKLPLTEINEKSWSSLSSMTFASLDRRAKELLRSGHMSPSQTKQYRYQRTKLKNMTDHIIDMDSFDSEQAFVVKCLKKAVKAFVPRQCPVCGAPAERRCGRCKLVRYCSTQCQLQHRPVHRLTCVNFSDNFPSVDNNTPPGPPGPLPVAVPVA